MNGIITNYYIIITILSKKKDCIAPIKYKFISENYQVNVQIKTMRYERTFHN